MSERAMKVAREIVINWYDADDNESFLWESDKPKLVAAIAAAIAAAGPEWLDISTAPKDGKWVDLWVRVGAEEMRVADCFWCIDGWFLNGRERYLGGNEIPTHYMLLPAPPQKDATDE